MSFMGLHSRSGRTIARALVRATRGVECLRARTRTEPAPCVRVNRKDALLTPAALQRLTPDGWLLFSTRFIRLFAYGSLSVVLVFYLVGIGLTEPQTGMLLTLTLAGDTAVSLFLTTRADRIGRRRMLVIGALLMAAAGIVFATTRQLWLLVLAGTIGVISPSGNEVGPFLSIEQAALSNVVADRTRTEVFAWYSLTGSVATALGALAGGTAAGLLQKADTVGSVGSYRGVIVLYAALGVILAALFSRLSSSAEAATLGEKKAFQATFAGLSGLDRSRGVVMKLSALFALDSFGGGFVVQSFAAYWFYLRFGVNPATLGAMFFWANVFAGISALLASRLAARFGLINTMVGTHLPSNVLLILVPLMPTLPLAIADAAAAVQHQPDGRADEAVVHDGRRHPGGAIGGGRHHRRRAHHRARRSARCSSASCSRDRR